MAATARGWRLAAYESTVWPRSRLGPVQTCRPIGVCLLRPIRHTSITAVYLTSRDLSLAQRFARHVSPLTTTVYTYPSDEEMYQRVRGLSC